MLGSLKIFDHSHKEIINMVGSTYQYEYLLTFMKGGSSPVEYIITDIYLAVLKVITANRISSEIWKIGSNRERVRSVRRETLILLLLFLCTVLFIIMLLFYENWKFSLEGHINLTLSIWPLLTIEFDIVTLEYDTILGDTTNPTATGVSFSEYICK